MHACVRVFACPVEKDTAWHSTLCTLVCSTAGGKLSLSTIEMPMLDYLGALGHMHMYSALKKKNSFADKQNVLLHW